MLERKKIKDLNDYFLKLEERKEKGVYFYRICGYSEKVGEFIKKYENRIINIHPSLIPSFCGNGFYGIKVHEAALKKGVKFIRPMFFVVLSILIVKLIWDMAV